MANEEHLAVLRHSVKAWNQWRKEDLTLVPNLSGATLTKADLMGADLMGADLMGANLMGADLIGAKLHGADLSEADLSEADLSEAKLILARLNAANLMGTNLNGARLNGARLNGARLNGANLMSTNLSETDLSNADLSNAKLTYVTLREARLNGANLNAANLMGADLSFARLNGANLNAADLMGVNLSAADLGGADLSATKIGRTVFVDVDLSEVKGLETIDHRRPSSIGIDTIYKSKGNIPYKFLLEAGVPRDDIPYLLSLAGKAIDFYSCFISYSIKDKAFAERLHADLQAKGVRTWYAPEDLKIGEVMLSGIDKGIQLHDKLLVILSEHSVTSKWVEHEVEAALYEESQPDRKTQVLFPIRLDDTVIGTKVNWAYRIRQRHIGDFTQWKDHDAYQEAFDRLLRDLKTETQK